MSHLVDQVALCGEHGEFDVGVSSFSMGVLASECNVHNYTVFGWVVHARRAVAAFVVALAPSSQNTRQVVFLQRCALIFIIPENMTQQDVT